MIGAKAPLVLALVALATAPPSDRPDVAEQLGWNARERTAAALSLLGDRRLGAAAEAFDEALRLRPGDPQVRFNAGTARLLAGREDAEAPLEQAADSAPAGLAADAWFNLGNARLAGSDPAGAAEAFRQSLRRAPSRADAKRNLELALRAQAPTGASPDGASSPDAEESRGSAASGGEGDGESPTPREQSGEPGDSSRGDRTEDADAEAGTEAAQGSPGRPGGDTEAGDPATEPERGAATAVGRLGFRAVPEMTAEQAEALLRAVETLEREQRRRLARERAPASGSADEDW